MIRWILFQFSERPYNEVPIISLRTFQTEKHDVPWRLATHGAK